MKVDRILLSRVGALFIAGIAPLTVILAMMLAQAGSTYPAMQWAFFAGALVAAAPLLWLNANAFALIRELQAELRRREQEAREDAVWATRIDCRRDALM